MSKILMQYALVAGGSKGIGFAIAEALARRNFNLILIGRNPDTLQSAKTRLNAKYNIDVETLMVDLGLDNSAEKISQWCLGKQIPLKMICNVAGLGGAKDYLSLPLADLRYMVRLNIESNMALCLTLLPLLEKNAPSYILNVGSLAGFAPLPIKNLYSATKSAIIFFSYGLSYQLKKKNISVSCLCPGPVFSKPEIRKETEEKLGWLGTLMAVEPEKLGEIAVRRTLNKRLIIVPGFLPKIISMILRTLPRRLLAFLYNKAGNESN
jgi:uncharacterized protein